MFQLTLWPSGSGVRLEISQGNLRRFKSCWCRIFYLIKLKNALEGLDRKTIKLNLLESIEYFYYSKNDSGKKEEKKKDNKGIREIKIFIRELLY